MSLDTLADEITKQARAEADAIIHNAKAEAKRIEDEARTDAELTSSKASSKAEKESQQISAQVKIIIRDCLMHLPEKSYPDNEIELNTMKVYQHIFSSYFGGNKNIYQEYN